MKWRNIKIDATFFKRIADYSKRSRVTISPGSLSSGKLRAPALRLFFIYVYL